MTIENTNINIKIVKKINAKLLFSSSFINLSKYFINYMLIIQLVEALQ